MNEKKESTTRYVHAENVSLKRIVETDERRAAMYMTMALADLESRDRKGTMSHIIGGGILVEFEKLEGDTSLLGRDRFVVGLDDIAQAALRAIGVNAGLVIDAPPPFDLKSWIEAQRTWSAETFGPGERTAGVVDHIRKELVEIEQSDGALDEWVDVLILALDGAWRAGYSPDEIITQLLAKTEKNRKRTWPDWRTAEPGKAIEHDRSKSE